MSSQQNPFCSMVFGQVKKSHPYITQQAPRKFAGLLWHKAFQTLTENPVEGFSWRWLVAECAYTYGRRTKAIRKADAMVANALASVYEIQTQVQRVAVYLANRRAEVLQEQDTPEARQQLDEYEADILEMQKANITRAYAALADALEDALHARAFWQDMVVSLCYRMALTKIPDLIAKEQVTAQATYSDPILSAYVARRLG